MAFLDAGFSRIGSDDYNRELVELKDIYIPENGYFYAYISYENDASGEPVWWDNFKVTHVSSGAIQRDDYYPMGLRHNKTVADNNINNYLYNGGTELNTTTGLYMTPFRRYSLSPTEGWRNPATGRFNGIDAMASSFSSMTPYQYAFNNPISFNDPTGLCPTCDDPGQQPHHRLQNDHRSDLSGEDHVIPNRDLVRDERIHNSLIHAFVVPADHHELPLTRQPGGVLLRKQPPRG